MATIGCGAVAQLVERPSKGPRSVQLDALVQIPADA